jgi:hypothetical protein
VQNVIYSIERPKSPLQRGSFSTLKYFFLVATTPIAARGMARFLSNQGSNVFGVSNDEVT